ncbi:MAG: NAD-dependent epimerase/dehydratase family protein [Actinomycetes bacterium]
MTDNLHVVLGASGGMGAAVATELGERGIPVRAVNRAGNAEVPDGGERLAADVSTLDGARRAVDGAAVVYHCAQPEYTKWATEFPPMTTAIADACEEVGAKLVLGDNLYMYGPIDGPIRENSPTRPASKKGKVREAMARELLDRHEAGHLRVAIGRASDYFGPHGAGSAPGVLIFEAIAKGRKPRWVGRLDVPHTLNYLPDVGRGLVTLGTHDEAYGSTWILPANEALTGAQWLDAVGQAWGRPVKPAVVSPMMNRLAGVFVPMVREMNEIMYQCTEPFVVDDSAFRAAFGSEVRTTPNLDALRTTIAWFAAVHDGASTST